MALHTVRVTGVERFISAAQIADCEHFEAVEELSQMGVLVDADGQYVLAVDPATGCVSDELIELFSTDDSFMIRYQQDNARRKEALQSNPHPELTLAGQLTHLVLSRSYGADRTFGLVPDLSDSACEALNQLSLVTFPARR